MRIQNIHSIGIAFQRELIRRHVDFTMDRLIIQKIWLDAALEIKGLVHVNHGSLCLKLPDVGLEQIDWNIT